MKSTEKYKSIFEGKSIHRNKTFYSYYERNTRINVNQNFVVPWQMTKVEERKILIE